MATVKFKCPACGADVVADDGNPPSIIHPLPTCKRYDELDDCEQAADYMRESRMKYHPETFS